MPQSARPIYPVVAVVPAGLLLIIAVAWLLVHTSSASAAIIVIAAIAISLSFYNQDIAAVALIFAMIFSPEIGLQRLRSRDLVLRFDDIMLLIFFLSWLARMSFDKRLQFVVSTPINRPIFAYISVALISTVFAVFRGDVDAAESFFFFLKYAQYFVIFLIIANTIRTEEQLKLYFTCVLLAAALAVGYGLQQVASGVHRISLPFEGPRGEANTFGGYLLIIFGIVLFLSMEAPELWKKLVFALGAIVTTITIAFTYSRASYLGWMLMILFSIFLTNHVRRLFVIMVLLIAAIAGPSFVPMAVKSRVMESFSGRTMVEVAPYVKLNMRDSSYLKYEATKNIYLRWSEHPIIGNGTAGVGLVDTQYPRIMGELGILGMISFIWIVIAIFSSCLAALRFLSGFDREKYWQWRALVAGYLCAFIGLLGHGIGANTFIIIRIMEPFWFLTAMVVVLPSVLSNSARMTDGQESHIPVGLDANVTAIDF